MHEHRAIKNRSRTSASQKPMIGTRHKTERRPDEIGVTGPQIGGAHRDAATRVKMGQNCAYVSYLIAAYYEAIKTWSKQVKRVCSLTFFRDPGGGRRGRILSQGFTSLRKPLQVSASL